VQSASVFDIAGIQACCITESDIVTIVVHGDETFCDLPRVHDRVQAPEAGRV